MIQSSRIRTLADREARPGDYVLYWMQQSQPSGIMPWSWRSPRPTGSTCRWWWASA